MNNELISKRTEDVVDGVGGAVDDSHGTIAFNGEAREAPGNRSQNSSKIS
jgi:hypothetical protein